MGLEVRSIISIGIVSAGEEEWTEHEEVQLLMDAGR